jgi:large subunit ribosomal protein L1
MAKANQAKNKEDKPASKKKQLKHAEVVAEAVPTDSPPEVNLEVKAEKPVKTAAKAGKRSTKAQQEAEAKQAKQTRKTETAVSKPAKPQEQPKAARSKAERAGKKYREALKLIDKSKSYPLNEALDLAVKTSPTKFDGTIEMHINLGVDPKQADQNVRDSVVLPAGTGKNVRIAVLADGEQATLAKKAGADIAGKDEIFAKLDKEDIDFDVLIAAPAMMPQLGKYARLLGPRGLMPNPKSGTVSQDPAAAVQEQKAGKVEYRVDQHGIIHLAIGKASFGGEKLLQNAEQVLSSVRAARPATLKGIYIKSSYVTSTMGPSIKVEF